MTMKNAFLPMIIGAAVLLSVLLTYQAGRQAASSGPEYLEVYTPEDIYYLRGRHLASESGRYDLHFRTCAEAARFLADLTADDTAPYVPASPFVSRHALIPFVQ